MRFALQDAERRSGLSPWEIANKLGISYSHYTKIKRGEKNPSLQLAKDMADLFNESVDTLFFGNEMDSKSNDEKGGD